MNNQVLTDIENKVQAAINSHKWTEAYAYCLEVLKYDPLNSRFIKFKNLIEIQTKKNNEKAVLNDLKKIKYLFNEGKYEEYLQELKKLHEFAHGLPVLIKEIAKVENILKKAYENKQQQYLNQKFQEIKDLESHQEYSKAIQSALELLELSFNKKEVNQKIQKLKQNWINYELESNRELLKSGDFEKMIAFYQKLQSIDPQNQLIRKLLEKSQNKYFKNQLFTKKELVSKKWNEIKALYKAQKYEKVLDLLKEILVVNPKSFKAIYYQKKALKQLDKNIKKTLNKQIKENFQAILIQYKENKEKFIKI